MADVKAGIYEIRSYLAPSSLALDVKGANLANGENLWIFSTLPINTQKFVLTDEGDGWSIRCWGSNKYVDVAGGRVANDTNVQVWSNLASEAGVTRNQRWKASLLGTAEVDGVECQVVRFGAANADDFRMDVQGAIGFSTCNVQIFEASELDCQKWVLVPTMPLDDSLPTPYDMNLCAELGSAASSPRAGLLHPRFKVAYSKGATYLWRWRKRKMAPSNVYGDWSAWTPWAAPSGTQEKAISGSTRRVWLEDAVDCSIDFAECKLVEVQMQVRAVSPDGASSGRVCSAYEGGGSCVAVSRDVETELSGTVYWSPAGLRVPCSNDYQDAGLLAYAAQYMCQDAAGYTPAASCEYSDGAFTIPADAAGGIPAKGSKVRISHRAEQVDIGMSNLSADYPASQAVEYDGGTVRIAPAVADGEGATMVATVPRTQTVRMWVLLDGKTFELAGTEGDGKTTFAYEYPFGRDYKLFASYANADGSEWGTSETDMPAKSLRAHAWNWDGGSLVLWLDSDYVKESRDYSLSTDTHVLAGRGKPAVSILADSNGGSYLEVSGSVSGVLLPDDRFGCTVDSVEALLKQGFARYRSPSGRMADVAVTGASVEISRGYASVSIDQVEVSS